MNSKVPVKGKLGHVVQIHVWRKRSSESLYYLKKWEHCHQDRPDLFKIQLWRYRMRETANRNRRYNKPLLSFC